MRSGRLELLSVDPTAGTLPIHWALDCPTRGVVIINVTVGIPSSLAPLRWRAGDWRKPPLDIALSSQGCIESVQLVFQDEAVEEADLATPDGVESGCPRFHLNGWPEGRYLDERVDIRTSRLRSGELHAAVDTDELAMRYVKLSDGLRLGFDSKGQLVNLAIGPLTTDEWRIVDAAAPLA